MLMVFQFLCCQNIKFFVDACKNHFGLKESDLFEPMMLYNLTNFHKVLITLAKLSLCDIVKDLHKDIPYVESELLLVCELFIELF